MPNRKLLRTFRFALFLTAIIAFAAGTASRVHAQTATTIALLPSLTTYVSLVPGPSGILYGVTAAGNASRCNLGCGTIFELTRASGGGWTQTTLHTFTGGDGAWPQTGLLLDKAGNIYGATYFGGASANCLGQGCGVVFKLSRDSRGNWAETVLHSFSGGEDGSNPTALAFGASGSLVGATSFGGNTALCGGIGCGILFQLSPAAGGVWRETRLINFGGGVHGQNPLGILLDSSGNIFGTAKGGIIESACGGGYCGIVFEASDGAAGWKESIIHTFHGFDGSRPNPSLTWGAAGQIYGTTYLGGTACARPGCGTIFQLSFQNGAWNETIVHNFTDQSDGEFPTDGLLFDAKGNLYGGTAYGDNILGCNPFQIGACGQIFQLSSSSGSWQVTAEYSAPGFVTPVGDLLVDGSGTVFGAACDEYYFNGGSIFEIAP